MYDIKEIKERVAALRILVVDDEELIRMLMKNFMERLFGEVVTAEDGEDALHKWEEFGPFDVVLTDLRMPKMNGIELIKKLKPLDAHPYIIIASAAAEDAADELSQSDVFVEKPIGFNEIVRLLSDMIESKHQDALNHC